MSGLVKKSSNTKKIQLSCTRLFSNIFYSENNIKFLQIQNDFFSHINGQEFIKQAQRRAAAGRSLHKSQGEFSRSYFFDKMSKMDFRYYHRFS